MRSKVVLQLESYHQILSSDLIICKSISYKILIESQKYANSLTSSISKNKSQRGNHNANIHLKNRQSILVNIFAICYGLLQPYRYFLNKHCLFLKFRYLLHQAIVQQQLFLPLSLQILKIIKDVMDMQKEQFLNKINIAPYFVQCVMTDERHNIMYMSKSKINKSNEWIFQK